MSKCIIYFTWSNNTKRLVERVNKEFSFPIFELKRKEPYSDDYNTVAYHEAKEEKEKWLEPEINDLHLDLSQCDELLVFFPIWWYTFPLPVATFLRGLGDYDGKVILFGNSYTDDPQYLDNAVRDAKKTNPHLTIQKGLLNKPVAEHISFIKEN